MKISASFFAGMVALCVIASGCDSSLRQDMANQPKNRPLSPSEFFRDGRSERPLLENTVAHGAVDNDVYNVPKEYAGFPVPVDEKFLLRGEDRYKVFCTPCHGLQGDGNGMIAMYSYSTRIPPRDRWAIVAYVRALQLSRNAKVSELPQSLRQKLESGGESSGGAKE